MKNLQRFLLIAVLAQPFVALAQMQPRDMYINITGGGKPPVIAVPDARGSGDAQKFMDAFNQTLFSDLQESGALEMAAKSMYPVEIPQRPQDFRPPSGDPPRRQGPWFTDWSQPIGSPSGIRPFRMTAWCFSGGYSA
jgi:hypothetical protein